MTKEGKMRMNIEEQCFTGGIVWKSSNPHPGQGLQSQYKTQFKQHFLELSF
jgi:hypothetical protein